MRVRDASTTCATPSAASRSREFDLVSVKAIMGHSKLTTTERYLHSRPRRDDAATLTEIFSEREEEQAA